MVSLLLAFQVIKNCGERVAAKIDSDGLFVLKNAIVALLFLTSAEA